MNIEMVGALSYLLEVRAEMAHFNQKYVADMLRKHERLVVESHILNWEKRLKDIETTLKRIA